MGLILCIQRIKDPKKFTFLTILLCYKFKPLESSVWHIIQYEVVFEKETGEKRSFSFSSLASWILCYNSGHFSFLVEFQGLVDFDLPFLFTITILLVMATLSNKWT